MKDISTLEADINNVLKNGAALEEATLVKFGVSAASKLSKQLTKKVAFVRKDGHIRASEIGQVDSCPRKFWYNYYHPEWAEALPPSTTMKFLYGDIIEDVALVLATEPRNT